MAHLTADTGDQAALRTVLQGALPDHLTGLSELLTREELQCLVDLGFTHAGTLQYLQPEAVEGEMAAPKDKEAVILEKTRNDGAMD